MSYSGARPVPTTAVTYRPVQFETCDVLFGLTLQGGNGFLIWASGASVHFKTHAHPSSWASNNLITSYDGSFSPGGTTGIRSLSAWLDSSGIPHVLVYSWTDSAGSITFYSEVWKADAAVPTSFTKLKTLQTVTGTSGEWGIGQVRVAGVPIVNGSTWVLPVSHLKVSFSRVYGTAGIIRSTDAGLTWTTLVDQSWGSGGRYTEFMSAHIGEDPSTGNLFWMAGTTGAGTGSSTSVWFRSTDGGATWSAHESVGPGNFQTPYTGYDGDLYGLERSTAGHSDRTTRHNAPDTSMNNQTVTGTHVTSTTDPNISHLCNGADFCFLFYEDTVQGNAAGGGLRELRPPPLVVPHRRLATSFSERF